MSKRPDASGSINTPGIKGVFISGGNIASPIEGLSSDAGLGKPPKVGEYGEPSMAAIPTAEKKGKGTGGAITGYFGYGKGAPKK